MSVEANKAAVRRMCEMMNNGHLERADEVVAPGCIAHMAGQPARASGPDGYRRFVGSLQTAFPDLQVTIEDMVGEGDRVAWRYHWSGTMKGVLFTVPPTGKHASWTEIQWGRFAEGKLVELWISFDMLDMFKQLGIAPQQG
jgi:steroid delta-isomerase-like uncharacterized protein